MDMSDARRLRSIEVENAKIKRLVADTMPDTVSGRICWESADDTSTAAGSGTQGDVRPHNLAAPGVCDLVGVDPQTAALAPA
jgi:hypothetical protein